MDDILNFLKLILYYLSNKKAKKALPYIIVTFYAIGIWKLLDFISLPFNLSANSLFEKIILLSIFIVSSGIIIGFISLGLKRWPGNLPIKTTFSILIVVNLLLVYGVYNHYNLHPFPKETDALGIYIAEFRGDKENKGREELIETLNNIISDQNLADRVKVKKLNRIIYNSKEAKELGKEGNARLVFWGYFSSKEKIHPYISVARDYGFKREFNKFIIGSYSGITCNVLEDEFPRELTKQPLSLIYLFLGLEDIERENYQDAEFKLQKAVKETKDVKILQVGYYYLGIIQLLLADRSKNKKVHLDKAIKYFKIPFKSNKPRNDLLTYIALQNGLALAYWEYPTINRLTNLKRAINLLIKVKNHINKNKYRNEYAIFQMNLGNVYSLFPDWVMPDHCKKAHRAYQEALHIFNSTNFPQEYALVKMNLGGFWQLCEQDETNSINKSIKAYKDAIEIFALPHFKEKNIKNYIGSLIGLAIDYEDLAEISQRRRSLEKKQYDIQYQKIMNLLKKSKSHVEYQRHMKESNELIKKRNNFISQVDKSIPEFFRMAEEKYKEAISIKDIKKYPEIYGLINYNLSVHFLNMYSFKTKESYLDESLKYLKEALNIFKKDSFEHMHIMAMMQLSKIKFKKHCIESTDFPYFDSRVIDEIVKLDRDALALIRKEEAPSEYFLLQYDIGSIYFNLVSLFCKYCLLKMLSTNRVVRFYSK